MPNPSPMVLVNGSPQLNGVDVAAGAPLTIQLADLTGVSSWTCRVIGTDETLDKDAINAGTSMNVVTRTLTLPAPSPANGATLVFESQVNGGFDLNGRLDTSYTTTFGVYILTADSKRVFASGERLEGSQQFGWIPRLNDLVRNFNVTAGVASVSGTLPIVVDNADPQNPIVLINAATALTSGSMSAADKAKLDASTSVPTSGALVEYGASNSLYADLLISPNWYSESSPMQITMDGVGSPFFVFTDNPDITANHQLFAPSYLLKDAVAGVLRGLPMNWRAAFVSGAESWVTTPTGVTQQNVIDINAECFVQLDLPHNVTLTNMYFKTQGGGAGADPGNLPAYFVVRQHMGTLSQTVIGSATDPGGAPYRSTSHWTTVNCSSHVIDTVNYRYYAKVTPETGVDSQVGLQWQALQADLTFGAGYQIGLK